MRTLFDPVRVGRLTLANRLVMNPMTRSRADAAGLESELTATYFAQRASAGLLVVGGVAPSPNGKGYPRTSGLWNLEQVERWKLVTSAVHAAGGHIFTQILHTGRVSHPANMPAGAKIVAPSALAIADQTLWTDAHGMQPFPIPEALDVQGLEQTKREHVTAAKHALLAGFDGVELHAANGYLLEQFLSPVTNQRTDWYGGSVDNRVRFVVEVAHAVAEVIGGDRLAVRISPYAEINGHVRYPDIDETYLALVRGLAPIGLAYLHVADQFGTDRHPGLEALKPKLREAALPSAFLVGGSFDKATAEQAVRDGRVDLVGFGKAFVANPDLVRRFRDDLPLNTPDPSTFFTPGAKGYIDYPTAWTADAPAQVVSVSPVTLAAADARGAALELRVSAPVTGSGLPVLVFAHGFAQSADGYLPLTQYWAARGFVVIQPTFLDSWRYGLPDGDPRKPVIWQHRAGDVTNILDHLDEIVAAVPGLALRIDRERIALAGHSFGAHTAGLVLGARVRGADGQLGASRKDERIKAAVLLSTGGRGGEALSPFAREHLPYLDQDFAEVTTKTLVVAGDADVSPLTVIGPAWFTDAYTLMPGASTLVTIKGGEHMLGGIDGLTGHGPSESPAQVAAVQRLTWAWLRTALYPEDPAWPNARDITDPVARVEEKS